MREGRSELVLEFDTDAITRTGLNPGEIGRTLMLLVDGLVVADMRDAGEKLGGTGAGGRRGTTRISPIFCSSVCRIDGGGIALADLAKVSRRGLGNIRHYNFRRAITVEAGHRRNRSTL